MRIANLPWYDFDELRDATDALWSAIAERLADAGVDAVPGRLDRETNHVEQWRRPELLLSQACGYDVLHDSADDLAVVTTPQFSVPGCEGGAYRSVVVVRLDDPAQSIAELRSRRCVVNEACSHSGTNALRPLVAPWSESGRFFGSVLVSGDHATSLEMVGDGRADVACIDVVVFEMCRRVRPSSAEKVRVLAVTDPAPAPPYVTSLRTPPRLVAQLRDAVRSVMADPRLAPVRRELLLDGVVSLRPNAYEALRDFEMEALSRRYFELPAPSRSPLHRPLVASCSR
jgi:ABC-type phosphate/phosphonate transport system substrate-binding protein